ncbi:FAD-dependent oxidoreductase [Streptomyces sp. NPDC005805]|uniref:FAD-dependent oxidoreductase n=1 Tax=Streptomyces sp. NPDC005805 TaxID=3157068 RepID=UPI0033F75EAD
MTPTGSPADSLWNEYDPGPGHPPLRSPLSADLVVVGGGMAGICTAFEACRAGREVVLVEADRPARGVTGRTTAKVSALQGTAYRRIGRVHGEETARRYAASQAGAVERVARLAGELDIDCDLERAPAYTYVTDPAHAEGIRREADAAAAAGLPVDLLTEPGDIPLPFPVAAAVRLDAQVQFHPRKFLLGLVRELLRRGGTVLEGTRVTGLTEGRSCRLETSTGHAIEAADVVVATHYPVFDRALLFPRLDQLREVVVAAPLPPDARLGDGMFLTEEEGTRSLRTVPHGTLGRVVVATGEKFRAGDPGDPGAGPRLDRLTAWAREHLGDLVVSHRWATQDVFSSDHLPHIGRLHPGARHTWVATGFGGWGLSGGVAAGTLLADRLTGRPSPYTEVFDPFRLRPLAEGPAVLRSGLRTARNLTGAGREPRTAEDLAPGQGAVLHDGSGPVAARRDTTGRLHRLSARCTHLGCLVAFDEAEQAWSCPCHGSRFAADGAVLEGPAVRPLPSRDEGPAPGEPPDGRTGVAGATGPSVPDRAR